MRGLGRQRTDGSSEAVVLGRLRSSFGRRVVTVMAADLRVITNIHDEVDPIIVPSIKNLVHAIDMNQIGLACGGEVRALIISFKSASLIGEYRDMKADTVLAWLTICVSHALPVRFQ